MNKNSDAISGRVFITFPLKQYKIALFFSNKKLSQVKKNDKLNKRLVNLNYSAIIFIKTFYD